MTQIWVLIYLIIDDFSQVIKDLEPKKVKGNFRKHKTYLTHDKEFIKRISPHKLDIKEKFMKQNPVNCLQAINVKNKFNRNIGLTTNCIESLSTATDISRQIRSERKKMQYTEEINASICHRTFLKSEYRLRKNCEYKSKIPLKTKQLIDDMKRTMLNNKKILNYTGSVDFKLGDNRIKKPKECKCNLMIYI